MPLANDSRRGGEDRAHRRGTVSRRWLVGGAVAAGVVAVALGAALGDVTGERVGSGFDPPRAPDRGPPAPRGAPRGYVAFRDPLGRFSIAYPGDWERLPTAGSEVELLASRGRVASLLVRSVPLGVQVGRDDLGAVKGLTDRTVASGNRVRLLAEARRIELGGLPGLFYLYSFRDRRTGRRGTHSHYFLFQGETMITLVLQALPERELRRFATVFDRIAATFRAGRS